MILVSDMAFGSVVPDRLLQQAFPGHSIDVVGRNRDLLRKRFHVLPRALARRQRLQVGPLHQQGEVALEVGADLVAEVVGRARSEEHTSALKSLMRIPYALFCFKNT